VILRAWRRVDPPDARAAIVFGMFVASATTAMLTGDLTGHSSIWLTGGIGVGLTLATARRRTPPVPRV